MHCAETIAEWGGSLPKTVPGRVTVDGNEPLAIYSGAFSSSPHMQSFGLLDGRDSADALTPFDKLPPSRGGEASNPGAARSRFDCLAVRGAGLSSQREFVFPAANQVQGNRIRRNNLYEYGLQTNEQGF